MRVKRRAERLCARRLLPHLFQQIGHAKVGGLRAAVKISLNHLARNGKRRFAPGLPRIGRRRKCGAVCQARGVPVDHGVVFVLDGHGAQNAAALARKVHLGDGRAHPQIDIVRRHDPLLDAVRKDYVKIRALVRQRVQRGAVPFAGMPPIDELHLRVRTEIPVEPIERLGHADAVRARKRRKILARHFGKLPHLLLGHARISEAGDIQHQPFIRVQPMLPAQRRLIFKIARKFRPQKIHHHRARYGAVLLRHAVREQPLARFFAPAGLHAFFGVAVKVEPRRGLLRIAENLLPVQVHHAAAPAHIIVYMAVDGLVVVHAAGHQHAWFLKGKVLQPFAVEQLADLRRIAAPPKLRLQKQQALVFPRDMLV